jgi:Tfp pilus assembly protein PilX
MKKGAVLMLVMVFMLVLSILGLAVMNICGWEEIFSNTGIVNLRVFYLADSGIELAKGWLVAQNQFPENINANYSYPNTFSPPGCQPGVTYSGTYPMSGSVAVSISPVIGNNVNMNDPSKSVCGKYTINSTGMISQGSFTKSQNVSLIVFISTVTGPVPGVPVFNYSILPDSWIENPRTPN